ncbi:MAG: helicase-related protein [Chloroflexota bacterium]|nr:helicase [Chloroflexota bacterium]
MTSGSKTDLKFFTNSPGETLSSRFVTTLKHAQYFDILVGYFRTSGFYRLYEPLEKVEKIRILVGLNTDRRSFQLFEEAKSQAALAFESHKHCREVYAETVIQEMEATEDSPEIELAAQKFIEFIKNGKMELRAHPSRNIHAKVYITRFPEDFIDFGRVITGSSNFSESGLVAQREFNVELKDRVDVEYALERFEELWEEGVDISDDYVETIRNKTWLNDKITPYQIYLKFLYEYFKEDINQEEELEFTLPDGFMNLAYQRQAVINAKKILEAYNGVFLADVVGLGKTFITALLLQQLPPGRKLVICPPVLMDYWRETLHEFCVLGFDIESLGKLDHLLEQGVTKYAYIIVDEAHRFRNELTQSYEALHQICQGKKVILVSATPLNNKLDDIKTQIKLFQPTKNSDIPGVQNLEAFFKGLQKELDQSEKGSAEYLDAIKQTSEKVRDKVLKHIMVRRTRTEIKKYFGEDLAKQGLKFPEMADPQRIIYQFDEKTERAFSLTIELLKKFSYARYTPLLYLKKQLSEFDRQSQRNVGGFMKGILVKRLESSFYAFRKSLTRFIHSYERFIEMYDKGTVWISNKADVFELLESDDEERLQSLLDQDKAQTYPSRDFQADYRAKLSLDLDILERITKLWEAVENDPKVEYFIKELKENPTLIGRKVLVFSESKETVEYLYEKLNKQFPNKVLSYSSQGGNYAGSSYKGLFLRERIKANYEPKYPEPKDDVRILLTTDVLAEGINLHRSNIIINYDLPWNPTRVLQRVGRVNRVGTEHERIYVFNIFPTTNSDEHLGLEGNIKSKLQAFHNTLGEDAKYLSDDEQLSSHELFGDRLYRKLTNKYTYEGEEEVDSEFYYLHEIRTIRDKNPELFARIKNLPKKARSGRELPLEQAQPKERLLTFFRKGRLKKFVISDQTTPQELTFLEAARLFECEPETELYPIPQTYYPILQANKDHLTEITSEGVIDLSASRGGSSNETFIIKVLKSSAMRTFKGFTDEEEEYLKMVRVALENGSIPRNTTKKIKPALEKNLQPLSIIQVLKNHISQNSLYVEKPKPQERVIREIILSEYLAGNNK